MIMSNEKRKTRGAYTIVLKNNKTWNIPAYGKEDAKELFLNLMEFNGLKITEKDIKAIHAYA